MKRQHTMTVGTIILACGLGVGLASLSGCEPADPPPPAPPPEQPMQQVPEEIPEQPEMPPPRSP
jgi:hypothetical protein